MAKSAARTPNARVRVLTRIAITLFVLALVVLVLFLLYRLIPTAQRPRLDPRAGTPAASGTSQLSPLLTEQQLARYLYDRRIT